MSAWKVSDLAASALVHLKKQGPKSKEYRDRFFGAYFKAAVTTKTAKPEDRDEFLRMVQR